MNTDRADPSQAGASLGAVLWHRHTQTAFNAGTQTQAARAIGVSVFERHMNFVGSSLRRMAGGSSAGGAANARPVVIARRVRFDRQVPEFDAASVQPPLRTHVIRPAGTASREGESVGGRAAVDRRPGAAATAQAGRPPASGPAMPGGAGFRGGVHTPVHTLVMRAGSVLAGDSDVSGRPIPRPIEGERAVDRALDEPVDAHGIGDVPVERAAVCSKALQFVGHSSANGGFADRPLMARTPVAGARSTSAAGLPGCVDGLRSAVMRVPVSSLLSLAGTRDRHDATIHRAAGTASRGAVRGGLPGTGVGTGWGASIGAGTISRSNDDVVLSPRPLVVALRGWFDDLGSAPRRGVSHAQPQEPSGPAAPASAVGTWSGDVRAVSGIDGSIRIGRGAHGDRSMPIAPASLRTGASERGATHVRGIDTRAVDRMIQVTDPAVAGDAASSLGNGLSAGQDMIDGRLVDHASSEAAAKHTAATAGREDANVLRTGHAVSRQLPVVPVADREVARVTDLNARSIVQLLRGSKTPSLGNSAVSTQHMGGEVPTITESRSAVHDDGAGSQRLHRLARWTMHEADSPDAVKTGGFAAVSVASSTVVDAPPFGGDGHASSSAPQTEPRLSGAGANESPALDRGLRSLTPRLSLPSSPSPSPPVAVPQRAAVAIEPNGAATTQSDRIMREHASVPASIDASRQAVFDAAPSASASLQWATTRTDRRDARVPGFLRVFASAAPFATHVPATHGIARSQSASAMGDGSAGPHGCTASAGLSVRESGMPLPVDRLAEQYGVVPAAAHGVSALPQPAGPAGRDAAPPASRTGDANELAERAWQIIQDKLACERERRGYAPWP